MNRKKIVKLSALLLPFALTGCTPVVTKDVNLIGVDYPVFLSQPLSDFTKGPSDIFEASDGWTNGSPFDAFWKSRAIDYDDNMATFSITEPTDSEKTLMDAQPSKPTYIGSELRSKDHFHYGFYGVSMKPCKQIGVATTFFTYTGPGENNPWDEIDIEFLGKDTTKVQFNYFVDGQGGHEYLYDLGFDASEDFHDYGFYWGEDRIVWYVDGAPVYQVVGDEDTPLPTHAGKIMMNFWSGNQDAVDWMGVFEGPNENTKGYYRNVTYADLDGNAYVPPEPEPEPDVPDIDLSDVHYLNVPLTFQDDGNKAYTVVNKADNTSADVTYENVEANSYRTIRANVPEYLQEGLQHVKLTFKNNGTSTVEGRLDVLDGSTYLNKSASQDGKEIRTDLEWGGSFFTLEPGKETTVDVEYEGSAETIALFFDSFLTVDGPYSGSITISGYAFGTTGTLPEIPDVPVEEVKYSDIALTFGDENNVYKVENADDNKSADITYTDVKPASYSTIKAALPEDMRSGYDHVRFTLTNNGTEDVEARMDVLKGADYLNVSATKNDTETLRTDLEWGGSFFTLTPGETATVDVEYEGAADTVAFFFDSARTEGASFSGNIHIANYQLGTSGEVEEPDPEPEPDPDPEPEPEGPEVDLSDVNYLSSPLTFQDDGNKAYTVTNTAENDGATIAYENVGGSSYRNVKASIPEYLQGTVEHFKLTLKNTGSTAIEGRIDALNAEGKCINTSASKNGHEIRTDLEWGGSFFSLAVGEECTVDVEYEGAATSVALFLDSSRNDQNTYSGQVSLSAYQFGTTGTLPEEPTPEPDPEPDTPLDEGYERAIFPFYAGSENYQVTNKEDNSSAEVLYSSVAGDSYQVVTASVPENFRSGYNHARITLTNNGEETVEVRMDVLKEGKCLNTSATKNKTESLTTDLEWGGSFMSLAANETATIDVEYEGDSDTINFFLDSSRGSSGTVYSGQVTLSDYQFGKVVEEEEPVTGDIWDLYPGAGTAYQVEKTEAGVQVDYTDVAGNSYGTLTADFPEVSGTEVTFQVTNNGTEMVTIRADVLSESSSENIATSATVNGVDCPVVTGQWPAGPTFSVNPSETVTVTITYPENEAKKLNFFVDSSTGTPDLHSGSILFTNFSVR